MRELCIDHVHESAEGTPPLLKTIILFANRNYSNPNININYVADYLDINPLYLSRLFKKHKGIGLLDYIHIMRLNEAKRLMNQGESAKSTASTVGYCSYLTMARAFKKYEGTTPGRFRDLMTGTDQ
ncbi:MAG: helix-turn-helix transcriptional regulator [Clostridiales bacterium]|nr:helix-turn-helix transcriptional regulator [Clostridiales bacterium]